MGHDTVKAAIANALLARLPGYGWAGATVDVADELPVDNSCWPLVLVRTTRMTGGKTPGPGTIRCTYRCRVTIGVRPVDGDTATAIQHASDDRDQLLKAVRDALLHARGLGSGVRVTVAGLVEDTEPVIGTRQGPREAYGQISFDVTCTEPVMPPTTEPADPVITDAQVTTTAYPADHTL